MAFENSFNDWVSAKEKKQEVQKEKREKKKMIGDIFVALNIPNGLNCVFADWMKEKGVSQ